MKGDLMEARQAIVDALDRVPYLSIWAFEFTPASPEPADTAYLRHVREANIVIWLVGAEVTDPVVAEIEEALANNRDFVVIRFGSEPMTPTCQALFDRVRTRAKYAPAADVSEVPQALELAMQDIAARALVGEPRLGRVPLIEELGRASRQRCVVRWQTPGLTRAEAVDLADDPSIGEGPASVLPDGANRIIVLTGEMGAGKSLCAERHLQRALETLRQDGGAPIPVWLKSKAAQNGLTAAVRAVCDGIGEPRVQGATIVVDGVDEVGTDVGEALLNEARELAYTWPHTTVLLTARPMSSLRDVEELRSMPPLTDDETWRIAERAAGRELPLGARHGVPKPVRDSMRRPLFALLYGIWQRQRQHEPRSQGDLLAYLGERAERATGHDLREALIRLSIASVRRELGPVPAADVGSTLEVRALLNSGLVTERAGAIEPGLPVLAQWFASQALLEGQVTISELLESPDDLDLWRYPLALAVATGSHAAATNLLRPLMQEVPGFAFVVIDEALTRASLDGTEAPPWREAGAQMREALEAIAAGIAPLHKVVLPVDSKGRLLPLGVASGGEHVSYAFWHGADARPDVFALTGEEMSSRHPGFPVWGSSAVGRGAAWSWRWARDQVTQELQGCLKARALELADCPPWIAEQTWAASMALAGTSSLMTSSLAIQPLLETLSKLSAQAKAAGASRFVIRSTYRTFDSALLEARLQELVRQGATDVTSPLPGPDLRPDVGIIGLFYSDERLVEVATRIYLDAIEIYRSLVAQWFGKLGDRLSLAATLPARFEGRVFVNRKPEPDNGTYGVPQIEGHFVPLKADEPSSVRFETAESSGMSLDDGREQYDYLQQMRPHAARWIGGWRGGSLFNVGDIEAASKLAYAWLWRDLDRLKLVSGVTPFH